MASLDCKKKELVSFSAMAAIEVIMVVLATLYKAAAVNGLSYFVVITYSNAISALVFLPLLFIFPRAGLPSIFEFPIVSRFVLQAFLGYTTSVCAYKGIDYTSPTITSCISNLQPAFIFVFAVIFRMESLDLRNAKTQAKVIGTIVSISGALVTILYKGPVIFLQESRPSSLSFFLDRSLRNSLSDAHLVIGGVLLLGMCLFGSLTFIVQTQIVKLYPNELNVGIVSSLLTSIIAAIFGAILETNKKAWTLRTNKALITVVFTGIFGCSLPTVVHTWGLNTKGPVYVSIFKPFSIVIAATMGVMFLGDSLYLGSVIGAAIILVGFYSVLWGKTEEKDQSKSYAYANDGKAPLLA